MAAILLIMLGAGVALYPMVANFVAQRAQAAAIADYGNAVAHLGRGDLDEQWRLARAYNDSLAAGGTGGMDGAGAAIGYGSVLNIDGSGVMGYLTIPRIGARLPIRHGTSETVLAEGAGHLETSALPTGGSGLHSVLTGHRGLPSAELFTRLDELERGDAFTVTVLNETHRYRVIDIQVVEPDDVAKLAAQPGRDLVTLVTCTPYGINTHRLLVTGERDGDAAETNSAISGGVTVRRQADPVGVWLRRVGLAFAALAAVGSAAAAGALSISKKSQARKHNEHRIR
ncbi:class C sortase [Bifidobacterium vespertilionis]|uniref:class C sortase n=1 Tax=Bifidobacterium vespertilionis TaxID=2562524 RepID=UPI001BDCAC32|nr:class C sortase [Bifidobacterium vespertilionis]MBT1178385.1 class C sortase [Bifidobacterium vespertilionis]